MDYLILTDADKGTVRLTTDGSTSDYGIPVLRIEAEDICGDFRPADIISDMDEPERCVTAASIVHDWASGPDRTADEMAAARLFLGQWPDGPQVNAGK